jgi:hypothetical protein
MKKDKKSLELFLHRHETIPMVRTFSLSPSEFDSLESSGGGFLPSLLRFYHPLFVKNFS